jgi:CBS domain containing-hemolysin-like protein
MVPDIVAVDLASPLETAAKLIIEHGFTPIPAYRGDRDHIEGIVHAKGVSTFYTKASATSHSPRCCGR